MPVVLIIAGVIITLVAALADVIGYGDQVAFGMYQMTGTLIGIVIALVGVAILAVKKGSSMEPPAEGEEGT